MRGYCVYSEATAGEELSVSPGIRRTVTVMPIALAVEIYFAGLIFAVLRIPRKFPHREINCNYGSCI